MFDDETLNAHSNATTSTPAPAIKEVEAKGVRDSGARRVDLRTADLPGIEPTGYSKYRDDELDRLIEAAEAVGDVGDDAREEAEKLFFAAKETDPSLLYIDKEMLPGRIGELYRTAARLWSEWLALDTRIENWRPSSLHQAINLLDRLRDRANGFEIRADEFDQILAGLRMMNDRRRRFLPALTRQEVAQLCR